MEPSGRRPTGADVARLAGVNQASVSRVFAGKASGRVSPEIEERIREAARTLGYQPHASGRSLRSGRTDALGLVVTDFENPYFGGVSRGAQREARAQGRSIVLMEADFDGETFLPYQALDAGLVDGLLLFSIGPPPRTAARPGQVTLIESEQDGFGSVVFDSALGMNQAVTHLTGLGHRRIGYLGAAIDRWTFRHRHAAWLAAMESIAPDAAGPEASAPLNLDAAALATRRLLSSGRPPTALICADDVLAAGAFRAAAELGLSIPGDLSVVGFGGTIVGDAVWPRLTGIAASGSELGAAAVALHLAQQQTPTVLAVELIPRGSTGRALSESGAH
ncbi:LacI family DNA-binding transcriptional regulator [Micropruina sp.]|uniref:LacI family DNA-binding transcriptional regulator n=1 Tax=Micropruina sp. TaxID=2737536 RepID=UPI00260C0513|nr:LacI family DNA-binding transcriptional regulator [Micropruina sp.]